LIIHDGALGDLYDRIRPLLLPPEDPPSKPIGFGVREARARYGTVRKMGSSAESVGSVK